MLWQMVQFPIVRYLLTFVRKQGVERAERHIEIAKIIWEIVNLKTAIAKDHSGVMRIHDLMAEQITDDLPEMIGFDLDAQNHDWDILADRFFARLLSMMDQLKPQT